MLFAISLIIQTFYVSREKRLAFQNTSTVLFGEQRRGTCTVLTHMHIDEMGSLLKRSQIYTAQK